MERLKRSGSCGNRRLWFPTHAAERSRMDGARSLRGALTGSDSCGNEVLRFLLEGL
jgi:hypothetical protein